MVKLREHITHCTCTTKSGKTSQQKNIGNIYGNILLQRYQNIQDICKQTFNIQQCANKNLALGSCFGSTWKTKRPSVTKATRYTNLKKHKQYCNVWAQHNLSIYFFLRRYNLKFVQVVYDLTKWINMTGITTANHSSLWEPYWLQKCWMPWMPWLSAILLYHRIKIPYLKISKNHRYIPTNPSGPTISSAQTWKSERCTASATKALPQMKRVEAPVSKPALKLYTQRGKIRQTSHALKNCPSCLYRQWTTAIQMMLYQGS